MNAHAGALAYLIPEFPGQTHIWMWREIAHMRDWGVPIRLFSTRRPPARDRARHAFAEAAAAETTYLWPLGPGRAAAALIWAAATRPLGLLRCLGLAATLPTRGRFRALRGLALVVPACILARACARAGVRHLHSHSCGSSAVLAMLARRLSGVPFSMTLNAEIAWWGGAMAEKFADADFTIAISERLLAEIRRDFPALGPRQALLGRIGVDTRKWSPDPKPEAGPGPETAAACRVVAVGRLHQTKGHDVLIRAVEALARDGLDVTLRIIGEGPRRAELQALADAVGPPGRVRLLGSLSEDRIIAEMRDADVFALASRHEPLGVAYMEAMAMGLATIGTATGGVAEIITDGADGLLVPPGSPEALAAAIRRLAEDPELRRGLAAAGRATVAARVDSRVGAATLYERLFGRPPVPDPPAP